MSRKSVKTTILTGLLGAALLSAGGCAGFRSKFSEKQAVNFGPFADQTVTLLSSLNYDLSPNELFLIRPFTDMSSPDLKQLQDNVQLERDFLKGIISYSVEIVNLSESGASQPEQVKAYSDYMTGLVNAVVSSTNSRVSLTKPQIDNMLANIRQKKTLLEAMQGARPLIIEFNQTNIRLIQSIATGRGIVVKKIQETIDLKFNDFVQLEISLRKQKARLANRLSAGTLSAASQKSLTDQMIVIKKRQEIIQPDLDTYRELKLKMDGLARQHDEMIRAGGRAVLLWSQAHQAMANGVTNPAEWLSMNDLKNALVGTAKKAI